MNGERPTKSGGKAEHDGSNSSSGSRQENDLAAGSAASAPAKPAIRHLDVELRDAYRETFDQEAGNVTAVPAALGGYSVTVLDPSGKVVPGIGRTREAAYDNLIARIKGAAPQRNG